MGLCISLTFSSGIASHLVNTHSIYNALLHCQNKKLGILQKTPPASVSEDKLVTSQHVNNICRASACQGKLTSLCILICIHSHCLQGQAVHT